MSLPNTDTYFWREKAIQLRPVYPSDWEQEYVESADSDGVRFLEDGLELPQSPEATQKTFAETYANFKNKDQFLFFSIETMAGELVGYVLMHSRDQKNGTFSFGIRIARAHRQKGYAEQAVRIVLRYGFYELRYQKANSGCLEHNIASAKLHRKLGFVEEGRRRRNIYTNGQYYDSILFGLTREEFDQNERNYASN